jgi:argininosuccinate synthase
VLEDPADEAPDYVYQRTVHPEDAPDKPEMVEIGFEKGRRGGDQRRAMSPGDAPDRTQRTGRNNGIGRSTWWKTASSA